MAGRDEGFLRRWSRLKRKDRKQGARSARAAEGSATPSKPAAAAPAAQDAGAAPPDLPDIETLDKDSDYTVFLHERVPEKLRTLALRKLWRSHPAFRRIDGLDDYDDDFRTAFEVGEGLLKKAQEGGRKLAASAKDRTDAPEAAGSPAAGEDDSRDSAADEGGDTESAGEATAEGETPSEGSSRVKKG